jgi:ligand-binding SRPBCC domain-containing protein
MRIHTLRREQLVRAELPEVFEFFSRAANLEALTPEWLSFRLLGAPDGTIRRGRLIDYRLRLHGIPIRWRTLIEVWEPGVRFLDLQMRGPYALWSHLHEFEARSDGTLVRDEVLYALPLSPLGDLAHPLLVKRDLRRIFDHRQEAVRRLLESSATRYSSASSGSSTSRSS